MDNSAVHKLDKYVLGPTSLVIFDEYAKGTTGIFANTMNELYKKMELREIERLYDILDGSELCRYVSSHNHKCYALFLPTQLFQLLEGDLTNERN